MNILERAALELLWVFCWLVGRLPHFVQFRVLAPALRFMLYRVLHYRQRVVDENLRRSFPERSSDELSEIRDNFYTIISEVFISTMALSNRRSSSNIIPKDRPRFKGDVGSLNETMGNKSWIALTSHYGLWEYMLFWSTFSDQRLLAVYHPLASKVFDRLLRRLRSHHKVQPIPSKETLRFVLRNGHSYRGESYLLGLIADQSPRRRPNRDWYSFLGQDTVFYDGGEKIAMKMNFPTLFISQRRYAPGRYEMCYKPIWDGVESIEAGEIMSRYVALLESEIRENPHMWLWSHRRWKAKRTDEQPKEQV